MKNIMLFLVVIITHIFHARAQTIITVAGNGTAGYSGDGGAATSAQLFQPSFINFDAAGNMYIAEVANNCIRKVSVAGVITTIAGDGTPGFSGDNGPATLAKLNSPIGVATDNSGNVYIADNFNNRIRKINSAGLISTIAGTGSAGFGGDNGPATAANINTPHGISIDGGGNIYIADMSNNRIRKISPSGIISTIAGISSAATGGDGGPATAAGIFQPYGIALDGSGNIYFTQYGDHRIRKVNASGIISTVAGTGTVGFSGDGGQATAATLRAPTGIAVDAAGNIYFSDCSNYRIRRINTTNTINTIAGTGVSGDGADGGIATLTNIGGAIGVCAYGNNVYFSDVSYSRIRSFKNTVAVRGVNSIVSSFYSYPNPSNGAFTIHISSATDEQVPVIIANVAGQVIREVTVHTNEPLSISLNVPSGLYFLTAITNSGIYTHRAVVTR